MAKAIESLSGDDLTAFKQSLGLMGYMKPIGTPIHVSSPVPYVDFTLPSDCRGFIIGGWDIEFSARAALGLTFSFDGGGTFVSDTDNFDSYGQLSLSLDSAGGSDSLSSLGALSRDAVAYLAHIGGAAVDFWASLSPGNASRSPRLSSRFWGLDPTGGPGSTLLYTYGDSTTFLNPAATVAPTYARCDAIRISPATSPEINITSGVLALFGVQI